MLKKKNKYRNFGLFISGLLIITLIGNYSCVSIFTILLISIFIFITIIVSLFYPNIIKPIYNLWMKIGNILGKINSTIIFSILYFFIITPISLLLKINRKKNKNKISTWTNFNQTIDFKKQY